MLTKAHIRKRNLKRLASSVVVIISLLLFLYYPVSLERTIGINDITGHDISSISLYMWPPPYAGLEQISLENVTDQAFVESVLSVVANRTMRRIYVDHRRPIAINDYTMRADIAITFKDDTEEWVRIDYDPRYIIIDKPNGFTRYRLYGAGLDVKKLYETAIEKVENSR